MKKSLGQHFLIDHSAVDRIVSALELKNNEYVIEIGPGSGVLTRALRTLTPHYIGIEKDEMLADTLLKQGIDIVCGDALTQLRQLISSRFSHIPYVIVGNIPYYITGHLFRILGELEYPPRCIVLTIQKEVAQRVTARPPHMNLLAGSVQIWGDVEMLFTLPPQAFNPSPRVHSTTIRIIPHLFPGDRLVYYQVLKALFLHPRKMAINNLSEGLNLSKEIVVDFLKKLSLNSHARGHFFSIHHILSLSRLYALYKKKLR